MTKILVPALIVLGLLALPPAAAAEGSGHPEGTQPDKPLAGQRAKPKPKPKAPPPTTPTEPIPYDAYSGTGAPTHRPESAQPEPTMTPPATDLLVTVAPPPPAPAEPLPPPVVVEPNPMPPPAVAAVTANPDEISLRCDTRLTRKGKLVSSGTFYVDIFPSPVFPDQLASFQFRFADPNHQSLIRDSMCMDTQCSAKVSGAAYALVSQVTKKGNALRITLDRNQGAFYAEEIHGGRHLGEQGWCTVQPLPSARF